MTTAKDQGSIRMASLHDRYFYVWFTGRYACGWPEIC